MNQIRALLERTERLTSADHQTHRRYPFSVPERTRLLRVRVRYAPKLLSGPESTELVRSAVAAQSASLADWVGEAEAQRWAADFKAAELRVPNLLTISLDDAHGVYRGAGHRHAAEQELTLGREAASPGLVAGELTPGEWTLTLSAHTLVTDHCEVELAIEAELA